MFVGGIPIDDSVELCPGDFVGGWGGNTGCFACSNGDLLRPSKCCVNTLVPLFSFEIAQFWIYLKLTISDLVNIHCCLYYQFFHVVIM